MEPIDQQALLALQVRFQAIRIANGFFYEYKPSSVSIDPQELLLVPDTELPFVLLTLQPEGARRFMPADQVRDTVAAVAIARVDVVDAQEPGAKLKAGTRLAADIERACVGELVPGQRGDSSFGGLVVDTRLLSRPRILYGLGNDPIVIVEQSIYLPLHRTYGQP